MGRLDATCDDSKGSGSLPWLGFGVLGLDIRISRFAATKIESGENRVKFTLHICILVAPKLWRLNVYRAILCIWMCGVQPAF